jgi:hypothetical protein
MYIVDIIKLLSHTRDTCASTVGCIQHEQLLPKSDAHNQRIPSSITCMWSRHVVQRLRSSMTSSREAELEPGDPCRCWASPLCLTSLVPTCTKITFLGGPMARERWQQSWKNHTQAIAEPSAKRRAVARDILPFCSPPFKALASYRRQ